MLWKSGQPTPPAPPILEAPSVPCEMTEELAEFLDMPHPGVCIERGLDRQDEAHPPRIPGVHATDMGYSQDGGLCPRQLWLRINGQREDIQAWPQDPDVSRRQGWARGHETEDWIARLVAREMPGWRIGGRNLPSNYVHKSGQIFWGELDILLWRPPNRKVVWDIKEVDDHKLARLDAPRPSNVCQVQTYTTSEQAECGVLVYVARWGNKSFYVPRDDIAVARRADEVLTVAQALSPPDLLRPKVERSRNVGPDSIKVSLPWQCDYCPFLDHGCDGALPKKMRGLGIWGHLEDSGVFKPKIDEALVAEFVEAHDGEEMWT